MKIGSADGEAPRPRPRAPRGAPRTRGPGSPRLLLVRRDVVHRVLDGLDVLRLLVRDLDLELLLHRHHELDDVEGVGAEVLDERRGRLDLVLADAQLVRDDVLHLLLDRCRHAFLLLVGWFESWAPRPTAAATCTS